MIVKTIYKDNTVCFCVPKRRRFMRRRIKNVRKPITKGRRILSKFMIKKDIW